MSMTVASFIVLNTVALGAGASNQVAAAHQPPASLKYLWAKAYHIPSEYTSEESGYYSLCEGKNRKIYIGTAAYGRDGFLVEFDPATEQMRMAVDANQVAGLPLEWTGYSAQAKIHTRNFVGPSGTIYFGTKQGCPSPVEHKSGKIKTYPGGYVMTYNPATGETKNLGMPMPLGDPRIATNSTTIGANLDIEGEGVIDVAADESRGLVYVVTCEHEYWMLYDMKHPEKGYRMLGPRNDKAELEKRYLLGQPNTLIDKDGRATCITDVDFHYQVVRYHPDTDKITQDDLLIDGIPYAEFVAEKVKANRWGAGFDWRLAPDGRTAYLVGGDLRLFEIDLGGKAGEPVRGKSVGKRLEGKNPARNVVTVAPDGNVYSICRVDNQTGFGRGLLHHLIRYEPTQKQMTDLGVFAVKNPDFFDFKAPEIKNPDGTAHAHHGFHTLPDGTLTPLHAMLGVIVAHEGTVYATVLYPFTLLRVPPVK